MTRDLRVLLFSPLAGRDPASGDTSYTEALLADPPPGVAYLDYASAIAGGVMRVRGVRRNWRTWTIVDALIFATRCLELAARRTGVMFREPMWFVTVDPTAVDVVHQHLFAVRQIGVRVPVVTSAGMPLAELYRHRERWRRGRLRLATALEGLYARAIRADVPWLRVSGPAVMTAYSRRFSQALSDRNPGIEVLIARTAVPDVGRPHSPAHRSGPPKAAFVGRDFVLKGGDRAVAAFHLAREQLPDLQLVVVTRREDSGLVSGADGVEILLDAPRAMIETLLERADVMIAPTRIDCGVPYGVLEALRAGVPVVLARTPWLDDRLCSPAVELVEPDASEVAAAVVRLLESPAQLRRHNARDLWERCYSMPRLHEDLLRAYGAVTSCVDGWRM